MEEKMEETKETVNQENTDKNPETSTFTQEQVDAIVADRLKRERAKYADYDDLKTKATKYDEAEEASKSELQKATEKAEALQKRLDEMEKAETVRNVRSKVSTETGVPINLLYGEDEETCNAQAQSILQFMNSRNTNANTVNKPYPTVKDSGEAKPGSVTKESILSIKDEKKRIQAIKENIELFK